MEGYSESSVGSENQLIIGKMLSIVLCQLSILELKENEIRKIISSQIRAPLLPLVLPPEVAEVYRRGFDGVVSGAKS